MSDDHEHGHGHDHGDMSEDERARRAGHIILDGVTAADADRDGGVDPMELAFAQLLEIEAIELLLDEEADEIELDISPLMGGVMMVVNRLVTELAQRDGVSPEAVVMSIRAGIDESA